GASAAGAASTAGRLGCRSGLSHGCLGVAVRIHLLLGHLLIGIDLLQKTVRISSSAASRSLVTSSCRSASASERRLLTEVYSSSVRATTSPGTRSQTTQRTACPRSPPCGATGRRPQTPGRTGIKTALIAAAERVRCADVKLDCDYS
ncbi:unnamed protein product, partial [Prorocentrum cordatum]